MDYYKKPKKVLTRTGKHRSAWYSKGSKNPDKGINGNTSRHVHDTYRPADL